MKILNLCSGPLSLNGESGNAEILKTRLAWSGQNVELVSDLKDLKVKDIVAVLIGSASWRSALEALENLRPDKSQFVSLRDSGVPFFGFGLGWEILGEIIEDQSGNGHTEGLGIFPSRSRRLEKFSSGFALGKDELGHTVTGFINVASDVELIGDANPLINLVRGRGNDSSSAQEGLKSGNLFATRLSGPVFSLNPELADGFAQAIADRSGFEYRKTGKNYDLVSEYAEKARAAISKELGL